ncbi:MAG TPA: Ig-like domain-containing protein, partial [Longimicrobium sp.]
DPAPPERGGRGFRTRDDDSAELARTTVPGFAGLYIDGCTVVINLTDPPAQQEAARRHFEAWARERFQARPGCPMELTFRKVEYDFAQLLAWQRAVQGIGVEGVVMEDVDEVRNRLRYGVRDEAAGERLRRRLAQARVPAGAFVIEPGQIVCTMEGWPSVVVEVRDQDGRPAARGARLEIREGTFVDSSRAGEWDELRLGAGNRRPGTYSVRVTRPGYHEARIESVHVPGGPCGALERVVRRVTLRLRADAPAVRSVTVSPPGAGLGLPGITMEMQAWVDARPGVDTAVVWSSTDTTVARVTRNGIVTAACRNTPGEAAIVATSRAEPRVSGRGYVTVFAARTLAEGRVTGGERLPPAAEDCLRRLGIQR